MENKPVETWKEFMGEYYGKPGMYKTVPDYIVADIKKLNAVHNSTLRQTAEPVEFPLSLADSDIASKLKWKFENDDKYYSMSAPSLGFSKRIMVHYWPPVLGKIKKKHKMYKVLTWFNPSYEPIGEKMGLNYEKCPSVKKVCAMVDRFENIKVKYYDLMGEVHESEEFGLRARLIQHEIDHLNGILFIDQAVRIITKKEHRFNRDNGILDTYITYPVAST